MASNERVTVMQQGTHYEHNTGLKFREAQLIKLLEKLSQQFITLHFHKHIRWL